MYKNCSWCNMWYWNVKECSAHQMTLRHFDWWKQIGSMSYPEINRIYDFSRIKNVFCFCQFWKISRTFPWSSRFTAYSVDIFSIPLHPQIMISHLSALINVMLIFFQVVRYFSEGFYWYFRKQKVLLYVF